MTSQLAQPQPRVKTGESHRNRFPRFWPERRFGFIKPDGRGGKDVFVHISALQRPLETLMPGMRVEFEVTQSDRGPQAANVVAYVDPYAPSAA